MTEDFSISLNSCSLGSNRFHSSESFLLNFASCCHPEVFIVSQNRVSIYKISDQIVDCIVVLVIKLKNLYKDHLEEVLFRIDSAF